MEPTRWTVESSAYIRKDRWIGLREDSCRTASGAPVAPYYVLEYPDWVHVVALSDAGAVLLVRQYRHGAGLITLELPAGAIESSDVDPVAAAERELREETGCVSGQSRLIHTGFANPANQTNRIHTVLCTGVTRVQLPLSDDPAEQIESKWFPAAEAVALARSGALCVNFQAASLLLALLDLGRLTLSAGAST